MKRIALALLLAGGFPAAASADDSPLIPDCYAANMSRADFHNCVQAANEPENRDRSSTRGASATAQVQTDAEGSAHTGTSEPDPATPPDGMWARERGRQDEDSNYDRYAGPVDQPPPDSFGPSDGPPEADGPPWAAGRDDFDNDGPRYDQSPYSGNWRGRDEDDEEGPPADASPDF